MLRVGCRGTLTEGKQATAALKSVRHPGRQAGEWLRFAGEKRTGYVVAQPHLLGHEITPGNR
jgi:hypothetical protein